jgi:hypothetical protein
MAAVREMEERVDAQFGVGAFQDLGRSWLAVFLRRPDTREADLECLAGRLVRCGLWRIHGPAKRRLRERARANGRSPKAEQIELARFGLTWASDELEQPQRIRLARSPWLPVERRDEWSTDEKGNPLVPRTIPRLPSKRVLQGPGKWITDEHHRQVPVRPNSLTPGVKLIWYAAAAKRMAEIAIKADAPDTLLHGAEVLNEEAQKDDNAPRSALDALVATEEAQGQVAGLLDVASPVQEKIITALLERLRAGFSEDEARAAVADALGISRSTLRVQLHRLKRKAISSP